MKKFILLVMIVLMVVGSVGCKRASEVESYEYCIDYLIEQNEEYGKEGVTFRVDALNITGKGADRYLITVTEVLLIGNRVNYYDCLVEVKGDTKIISAKLLDHNPRRDDI